MKYYYAIKEGKRFCAWFDDRARAMRMRERGQRVISVREEDALDSMRIMIDLWAMSGARAPVFCPSLGFDAREINNPYLKGD